MQRLLEMIGNFAPDKKKGARDRRLRALASMVGAVVLSRATSDEALADDLLRAVRSGMLHDVPREVRRSQSKRTKAGTAASP